MVFSSNYDWRYAYPIGVGTVAQRSTPGHQTSPTREFGTGVRKNKTGQPKSHEPLLPRYTNLSRIEFSSAQFHCHVYGMVSAAYCDLRPSTVCAHTRRSPTAHPRSFERITWLLPRAPETVKTLAQDSPHDWKEVGSQVNRHADAISQAHPKRLFSRSTWTRASRGTH